MTPVQALQNQLIEHLRQHVPAVQGHVSVATQWHPHGGLCVTHSNPSGQTSGSVWLHGPTWRRNTWASCVPGSMLRQGNRFTRYQEPLAWDLLYDVLVLHRCAHTLNTVAAELLTCVAHAGYIAGPSQPQQSSKKQTETTRSQENDLPQENPQSPARSYALVWEGTGLSRDMLNTSGWHGLSGRLKIEGVLLHSDRVEETGTVTSQPVRLVGGSERPLKPI